MVFIFRPGQQPMETPPKVASEVPSIPKPTVGVSTISSAQAGMKSVSTGMSTSTSTHSTPTFRTPPSMPVGVSATSAPNPIRAGVTSHANPPVKPRTPIVAGTSSISPQRLGFSIHNLTSSPMATSANASLTSATSTTPSTPSTARTWQPVASGLDEAQKQQQRLQMELALMVAAACQGQGTFLHFKN